MNSLSLKENTLFGADQPLSRTHAERQAAPMRLSAVAGKAVLMDFDGGRLSCDAGLLLLKAVDQQIGLSAALASVLCDKRDARYTKHRLEELFRQRIFQIAAGYEDQNDADTLRYDPIVKMAVGRAPETGAALASQPTLSRFENTTSRRELYLMADVFLEQFVASYAEEPELVVLD